MVELIKQLQDGVETLINGFVNFVDTVKTNINNFQTDVVEPYREGLIDQISEIDKAALYPASEYQNPLDTWVALVASNAGITVKAVSYSILTIAQTSIEFQQARLGISTGIVKSFNNKKGFGSIIQNGFEKSSHVYVYFTDLIDTTTLSEGDKVKFEVVKGPKGFTATKVMKM